MLHASEQLRPDVQSRRRWWDILVRGVLDISQLVFLDETSVQTSMTRTHGRAASTDRVVGHQPLSHWKTYSFVSALRRDGLTAPFLIEGALDADSFVTYVEAVLIPTLERGDVVILDNVAFHKDERVLSLLRALGVLVYYLPPYSPDLNPIENAYSKLKSQLRKASPRDLNAIAQCLKDALPTFSPSECLNYIQHCGYTN